MKMAAPIAARKGLCQFKLFCRGKSHCRSYAKAVAVKEKIAVSQEPMPWEDRPEGILIMSEHPPFVFKFKDALNMHIEAAQPALANSLQAKIYADILLNFTFKKVTKPMKHYIDLIKFPHKFDLEQEKKFMVFTESDETLELAKSLGAHICGGLDLLERMIAGKIHKDDIKSTDFVLATPEIYPKMGKVRTTLKLKYPSPQMNTVGEDIKAMMEDITSGFSFTTNTNIIDDLHSKVQIPFGRMNQNEDELAENFDHVMQHFLEKKPESLPQHVKEVSLIAPPSKEIFKLNMTYIQRKPSLDETTQNIESSDQKEDIDEDQDDIKTEEESVLKTSDPADSDSESERKKK